jgi:hypothetical protein
MTIKSKSTYPKYVKGEMIRWPKRGWNLVRAIVVAEEDDNHWIVKDRTGTLCYAWKGSICPINNEYNRFHFPEKYGRPLMQKDKWSDYGKTHWE